jgi:hypothetical protein
MVVQSGNPQLLPLLAPKSIGWIILDIEENPFIMCVCIFVPMLDPVFFKRFRHKMQDIKIKVNFLSQFSFFLFF